MDLARFDFGFSFVCLIQLNYAIERKDEWINGIKVNPTQVRDLLRHPVSPWQKIRYEPDGLVLEEGPGRARPVCAHRPLPHLPRTDPQAPWLPDGYSQIFRS